MCIIFPKYPHPTTIIQYLSNVLVRGLYCFLPVAQRPGIHRVAGGLDQRFDLIVEVPRLFSAENKRQRADDARDAQVIVVEGSEPMVVRAVEGEHPVASTLEIGLRRGA